MRRRERGQCPRRGRGGGLRGGAGAGAYQYQNCISHINFKSIPVSGPSFTLGLHTGTAAPTSYNSGWSHQHLFHPERVKLRGGPNPIKEILFPECRARGGDPCSISP